MRKALLLYISIAVFVSSCIIDYYNDKLSVTNKSGKEISVLYSNDVEAPTENNVAAYTVDWNVIKPDTTQSIVIPGNEDAWHYDIEAGSEKKLFLYIFETDTLRKYEKIASMRDLMWMKKYFKSFSYSEKELNKINWNIVVGK